jgi:hypothetical protein
VPVKITTTALNEMLSEFLDEAHSKVENCRWWITPHGRPINDKVKMPVSSLRLQLPISSPCNDRYYAVSLLLQRVSVVCNQLKQPNVCLAYPTFPWVNPGIRVSWHTNKFIAGIF